ncbi:MAG TPA: fluoride efflux transporter CrcB [Coriobacteriia bacterium]
MRELAVVAAGGAIGAGMRWWLGGLMAERLGAYFPWHTLVVNISGAFLLGVLMALSAERGILSQEWRLFAGVGVLGGYTTFSTLAYESMRLLEQGLWTQGLGNMFGSGLAGLVAVVAGLALGRVL